MTKKYDEIPLVIERRRKDLFCFVLLLLLCVVLCEINIYV
jgi:hypothetical protein